MPPAPMPPARIAEQVIDLEEAAVDEEEVVALEPKAQVAAPEPTQVAAAPDAQAAAFKAKLLDKPEPQLPVGSPPGITPPPAVRKQRAVLAVAPAVVPVATNPEVEPEDAIRMALRSKRASFEHCYEQELKKQAAFSGFIVVALSLSASGKVTEARVHEGNRRDAVVGACIVAALRTMKLPRLTSEADLLIPIRLHAKEPS